MLPLRRPRFAIVRLPAGGIRLVASLGLSRPVVATYPVSLIIKR